MQKRQVSNDSLQQAKKLGKLFRFVSLADIQLLLQFCEWNENTVRRLLAYMETMKKPGMVLEQLLQRPEKTDEIIGHYLELSEKKFGKAHEQQEPQVFQKKAVKLLNELPVDLIMEIGLFLNPKEMFMFMSLCSKFWKTLKYSGYRTEEYFRKICKSLFRSLEPQLPLVCQFTGIRDYVLSHPLQFSPNIRNYVQTNLRGYIWQCSPYDLRVTPSYYKSMGKFQDMYYKAPRVHFNGYYMLRERYVRPAAQSILLSAPKFTVVYYYRYVRFVPDGSLLYTLSNNRLKEEDIADKLSLKNFSEESETIKGEYMQFKEQLSFKISKSTTIFSFDCRIQSINSLFDALDVQRFNLEIVDQSYVVQDINKEKQKEPRNFMYFHSELIARENPTNIQACSF